MFENQDLTPPAVVDLLRGLIDYAGFFPPASLSVAQAFQNFREYQESDFYWMLGRFVLPLGKLTDLADLLSDDLFEPIQVSIVMPPAADSAAWAAGLEAIRDFNNEHEFNALIDCIESKVETPAELVAAHAAVRAAELRCFWELPLNDQLDPLVQSLIQFNNDAEESRPNAKIRTGGVAPGAIPEVASVAHFISLCARNQIAFKATAGLHHPVRSRHPLTYAPDAPCDVMHGFLNLFLATTAAFTGTTDERELASILLVENPSEFQVESAGIRWGSHFWTPDQIMHARYQLGVSFGSCSFTEPVQDLQRLGWLPPSDESFSE